MWGSFNNTLVYAYNKPDRTDMCVTFWNMNSDERYIKHVRGVRFIAASGDNCLLVVSNAGQAVPQHDPDDDGEPAPVSEGGAQANTQHTLLLCNAIGATVDSKTIDIKPVYVCMTPFHVIVTDYRTVYVWQYRTAVSKLTGADANANSATAQLRRNTGRERMLDIEENEANPAKTVDNFKIRRDRIKDGICAITASKSNLIIARESGTIHRCARVSEASVLVKQSRRRTFARAGTNESVLLRLLRSRGASRTDASG